MYQNYLKLNSSFFFFNNNLKPNAQLIVIISFYLKTFPVDIYH
jgi:hypothetical protein